jgi:hypothetical protein
MGVSRKKSPFEKKIYVRIIHVHETEERMVKIRRRYCVMLDETSDKCKVSAMEKLLERDVSTQIKTPGVLVHKRTIPTERPPLVGEVSANFSG